MGDELLELGLQSTLSKTTTKSRESTDLAGHIHEFRHRSMGSAEVVLGTYEVDAVYDMLKCGCSGGRVQIDGKTTAGWICRKGKSK
jgi:hypothetical protein